MNGQITELAGWLAILFTTVADQVGVETGFVRRVRNFTAAGFVRTLVFGWLRDPQATLEDFGEELGISAPAVHDRFTDQCVVMMRTLLEKAAAFVAAANAPRPGLAGRFCEIYVEDCTSISLPASLSEVFPGCGGAKEGQGAAGIKALLRFEMITGALRSLLWDRQSENDLNLSRRAGAVPRGALYLADLGFWCLDRLRQFTNQGIHWISRIPSSATLCVGEGVRQKLAEFLQGQTVNRVDVPVLLGEEKLSCRLVAVRCPENIAAEKKRRLRRKMSKKGKQPSKQQLVFCEWLVLATNLSAKEFTIEELWTLYRVRWQIELVFKRWKSVLQMDSSNARTNGNRRLVELYAKLLGVLVTHWGSLLRAGLLTTISLHAILKRVRRRICQLEPILRQDAPQAVLDIITKLAKELQRLKTRPKRKTKPGTIELLLNPELTF